MGEAVSRTIPLDPVVFSLFAGIGENGSTPIIALEEFIRAKNFPMDERWASIGATNIAPDLGNRSFMKMHELDAAFQEVNDSDLVLLVECRASIEAWENIDRVINNIAFNVPKSRRRYSLIFNLLLVRYWECIEPDSVVFVDPADILEHLFLQRYEESLEIAKDNEALHCDLPFGQLLFGNTSHLDFRSETYSRRRQLKNLWFNSRTLPKFYDSAIAEIWGEYIHEAEALEFKMRQYLDYEYTEGGPPEWLHELRSGRGFDSDFRHEVGLNVYAHLGVFARLHYLIAAGLDSREYVNREHCLVTIKRSDYFVRQVFIQQVMRLMDEEIEWFLRYSDFERPLPFRS